MAVCSFVGCGKRAWSRGLCSGHYAQQRVGKELRPLQVQHHGFSEIRRFARWFDRKPGPCFVWKGSKNSGYGQWRNQAGNIELAHRASWRLFNGPIPKGLHVLHRCDNPPCVNPDHLFLGSQDENLKDMWVKNRARPGKSLGEKHGMAKLTADQVISIRSSKEPVAALAERYNLSRRAVYDILIRKTWKHI
jgi:hypothetical protein